MKNKEGVASELAATLIDKPPEKKQSRNFVSAAKKSFILQKATKGDFSRSNDDKRPVAQSLPDTGATVETDRPLQPYLCLGGLPSLQQKLICSSGAACWTCKYDS